MLSVKLYLQLCVQKAIIILIFHGGNLQEDIKEVEFKLYYFLCFGPLASSWRYVNAICLPVYRGLLWNHSSIITILSLEWTMYFINSNFIDSKANWSSSSWAEGSCSKMVNEVIYSQINIMTRWSTLLWGESVVYICMLFAMHVHEGMLVPYVYLYL